MPLLMSQKVAFLHIPKTGGTTIEALLHEAYRDDLCMIRAAALKLRRGGLARKRGFRVSPQHLTYEQLKTIVPDLDSWYSFAFVRSPWSRAFSEYCYRRKFCHDGRARERSFEDWLTQKLSLAREKPRLDDNHFRPQHEFIGPNTQVFRFEDFDASLNQLRAKLQLPAATCQRYKTGGDYRAAHTPRTIELIGDFYAEDIAKFGYTY